MWPYTVHLLKQQVHVTMYTIQCDLFDIDVNIEPLCRIPCKETTRATFIWLIQGQGKGNSEVRADGCTVIKSYTFKLPINDHFVLNVHLSFRVYTLSQIFQPSTCFYKRYFRKSISTDHNNYTMAFPYLILTSPVSFP